MKKNKTILMLTVGFVTVFLSSCNGIEDAQNEEQNAVKFTAGVTTRASGNTWDQGDQIGVTMYNASFASVVGSYSNYRYDAAATGTYVDFSSYTGTMIFPNEDVNIVAYYPYSASVTNTISINTQNGTQTDLLYATYSCVSGSTNIVPLEFNYKLAKIIVKLIPGTNSPDLSSVGISLESGYCEGSLNLKTGNITTSGSGSFGGQFKPTANANEYYLLLIPQTMPAGAYMNITHDMAFADINIPNQVFEAKEYTYTVTVNAGSARLQSSTIAERTKVAKTDIVDLIYL